MVVQAFTQRLATAEPALSVGNREFDFRSTSADEEREQHDHASTSVALLWIFTIRAPGSSSLLLCTSGSLFQALWLRCRVNNVGYSTDSQAALGRRWHR